MCQNNKINYLDMLLTISNTSKYAKWYINIIQKSLEDINTKKEIVEKHHIIPESFFVSRSRKGCAGDIQGNPNDKNNMVSLTPREHFLVHVLLPKMLIYDVHIEKAKYAVTLMLNCNKGNVRINSKIYEKVRKYASENNFSKTEKECDYCGEIRKISHEYSCPLNPNRKLAKQNTENRKNLRKICCFCGENKHPTHESKCKLNPNRKEIDQKGDKNPSKKRKICSFCGELMSVTHEPKCKMNPNRNVLYGNKNPKAKIYVISSPNGIIEVCGEIVPFCKRNGITLHRLKNNMIEGWSIIEKRPYKPTK